MNINIQQLIKEGEGISLEFKRAGDKLPESLFETICAFLNRNGGIVLLGITDDKIVEGINAEVAGSMVKNIANLSNNPQKLFPSFLLESEEVNYQGKLLIYVYVPLSSQVHRCNGKVYDRSADGDFELKTDEQIKNLYSRKNALYTENTIYPYLFETDFVPGLLDRANIPMHFLLHLLFTMTGWKQKMQISLIRMDSYFPTLFSHFLKILIWHNCLPNWDDPKNLVPACKTCLNIQKHTLETKK